MRGQRKPKGAKGERCWQPLPPLVLLLVFAVLVQPTQGAEVSSNGGLSQLELQSPYPTGSGDYGVSISTQGDYLVVGASNDDLRPQGLTYRGAAYLYRFNHTTLQWDYVNDARSTHDSLGAFGWSVAVDPPYVLVGAPNSNGNEGRVLVYNITHATNQTNATTPYSHWFDIHTLESIQGRRGGDRYGYRMATSGGDSNSGFLAVASVDAYNTGDSPTQRAGTVSVFRKVNNGTHAYVAHVLLQVPAVLNNNMDFGYALAMTQDVLVVGAPGAPHVGGATSSAVGAVYVFNRNQGGVVDSWGLAAAFSASAWQSGARFGHAVALGTEVMVVGAPYTDGDERDIGSVHILRRRVISNVSETWDVEKVINSPDEFCGSDYQYFGASVYVDPNDLSAMVGATGSRNCGTGNGKVWAYHYDEPLGILDNSTHWGLQYQLRSPVSSNLQFGSLLHTVSPPAKADLFVGELEGGPSRRGQLRAYRGVCPPQQQVAFPFDVTSSECMACPDGKYKPRGNDRTLCFQCPLGRTTVGVDRTGCPDVFAAVTAISPPLGPNTGATEVVATGVNFVGPTQTVTMTTDVPGLPAQLTLACGVTSATRMVCTTPALPTFAQGQIAAYNFSATPGGAHKAGYTPPVYTFYNATLLSSAPTSGPIGGATTTTFAVTRAIDSGLLRCRLGDATAGADAVATFVSATRVQCATPSLVARNVSLGDTQVALSLNGQQYSNAIPWVVYNHAMAQGTVYPPYALVTGNTSIVVSAPGLRRTRESPRVRLRDNTGTYHECIDAQWGVNATLHCRTLPMLGLPLVAFIHPLQVEVSPNADATQFNSHLDNLLLIAFGEYRITRPDPPGALSDSRPTVALLGTSYVNTGAELIRVRQELNGVVYYAEGTYRTSGEIRTVMHNFNDSGVANVSITLNNQQYTNAVEFNMFRPCDVGNYAPSPSEPCIPCEEGTFKDKKGSGTCTICPVDTYCERGASKRNDCPTNTFSVARSSRLDQCRCRAGYYEPNQRAGRPCTECPRGAFCSGSTALPLAKPGFWNSGSDFIFLTCPVAAACQGGSVSCAPGYSGFLCRTCLDTHYQLGNLCDACSNSYSGSLAVALLCFLLLLFVMRYAAIKRSTSVILLGIQALQLTTLFADFLFSWPDSVLRVLAGLSLVNANVDLAGVECLQQRFDVFDKLQVTLEVPIYVLALFVALLVLDTIRTLIVQETGERFRNKYSGFTATPQEGKRYTVREHVVYVLSWVRYTFSTLFFLPSNMATACRHAFNAYMLVLSFLYVPITDRVLQMFSCISVDATRTVLSVAPQFECGTGRHAEYQPMALAGLLGYTLGVPLLQALLLYLFRNRMDKESTRELMGTVYDRFLPRWTWFGLWEKAMATGFITGKVFLHTGVVQGMTGQVILLLGALVQVNAVPYKFAHLNTVSNTLNLTNFLVLVLGMSFLAEDLDVQSVDTLTGIVLTLILGAAALIVLAGLHERFNVRSHDFFQREYELFKRRRQMDSTGDSLVDMESFQIEELAWDVFAPEYIPTFLSLLDKMQAFKKEVRMSLVALRYFMSEFRSSPARQLDSTLVEEFMLETVRFEAVNFLAAPEVNEAHKMWVRRLLKAMKMLQDAQDIKGSTGDFVLPTVAKMDEILARMLDPTFVTEDKSLITRMGNRLTGQNMDTLVPNDVQQSQSQRHGGAAAAPQQQDKRVSMAPAGGGAAAAGDRQSKPAVPTRPKVLQAAVEQARMSRGGEAIEMQSLANEDNSRADGDGGETMDVDGGNSSSSSSSSNSGAVRTMSTVHQRQPRTKSTVQHNTLARSVSQAAPSASGVGRKQAQVQVVANYTHVGETDMDASAGEILDVLQATPQWTLCKRPSDGKQGYVPTSYCKKLE